MKSIKEELRVVTGTLDKLKRGVKRHLRILGTNGLRFDTELNKAAGSISFGKAWSIYKRIHQPNYVRKTVAAFGKSLRKKQKKLIKQRKKGKK